MAVPSVDAVVAQDRIIDVQTYWRLRLPVLWSTRNMNVDFPLRLMFSEPAPKLSSPPPITVVVS